MSIIEKTLQRLESASASSAQSAAHNPPPITDDLLYVAGSARPQRKLMLLWLLGLLAGLALAAAALGYWLLQRALPVAGPDVALSAAAPQVAAEAAPAPATLTAPVSEAAAPAALTQPADPPLPAAAVPALQPAPAEAAPPWLEAGWLAALDRGIVQAVPVWERGLHTLPDEAQLLVGHAILDRHGLSSALARREPHWAAFAVREADTTRSDGAPLFRVVVWLPPGSNPDLQQQVAQRLGHTDRLRAVTLKRRVQVAAVAPAATTAPAGIAASTAAGVSALSNIQPAQAQSALVQPGTARPAAPDPASAPATGETRSAAAPEPASTLAAPARPTPAAPPLVLAAVPQFITLPPPPASASPPASAATAPGAAAAPASRAWEARAAEVRELLRQGAFALVADRAEPLTRDFPDRWESWFWLGTAALSLGHLPQAEQALDRALALNPNVEQVLVQRAVAAQERGDHNAALRFLQQAALLAPRVPEIHLNLGFSFEALGRAGEAERSFRTFLALTEGNPTYAVQRQHVEMRLLRRSAQP